MNIFVVSLGYCCLPALCRHIVSFNSVEKYVQILLGIYTEIRDGASKDRFENAYLIYSEDNHIKIPPRFKLHLLYSLIKQ